MQHARTYEELYREHHDRVYRLALRISADDELAKDIAQEVHIRCWKNRTVLESVENPKAWILRVTRNLSIDKIRARKQTGDLDEHAYAAPASDISPARAAEVEQMMQILKTLIETLPDKQRVIFHLREIEGLQYKEIADVIDASIDEIKVNLFRARKKIREQLITVDSYGLSKKNPGTS